MPSIAGAFACSLLSGCKLPHNAAVAVHASSGNSAVSDGITHSILSGAVWGAVVGCCAGIRALCARRGAVNAQEPERVIRTPPTRLVWQQHAAALSCEDTEPDTRDAWSASACEKTLPMRSPVDFVALLRRLVAESRHLQNDPARGVSSIEGYAASIVQDELAPFATYNRGPLVLDVLEYVSGRPNLKVTYPGMNYIDGPEGPGPSVSFLGAHFDVAYANPDLWSFDPWKLTVAGDKLYGRGTTDGLGHVALLTCLLRDLAEAGTRLQQSIVVVFMSGKEGGEADVGVGATEMLLRKDLDALRQGPVFWLDAVGSRGPCCGSTGSMGWTLRAEGIRFHSGSTERAINSIEMASEALRLMQDRFYKQFLRHEDEIRCGLISGSTLKPTQVDSENGLKNGSLNEICPVTTIRGDIRVSPFDKIEDVMRVVNDYINEINLHIEHTLPVRNPHSLFVLPLEQRPGVWLHRAHSPPDSWQRKMPRMTPLQPLTIGTRKHVAVRHQGHLSSPDESPTLSRLTTQAWHLLHRAERPANSIEIPDMQELPRLDHASLASAASSRSSSKELADVQGFQDRQISPACEDAIVAVQTADSRRSLSGDRVMASCVWCWPFWMKGGGALGGYIPSCCSLLFWLQFPATADRTGVSPRSTETNDESGRIATAVASPRTTTEASEVCRAIYTAIDCHQAALTAMRDASAATRAIGIARGNSPRLSPGNDAESVRAAAPADDPWQCFPNCFRTPQPKGVDSPGYYLILRSNAVGITAEASTLSQSSFVPAGAVVNVVEVIQIKKEHRVRGRIEEPVGYISLLNTATGYRWARPLSAPAQSDSSSDGSEDWGDFDAACSAGTPAPSPVSETGRGLVSLTWSENLAGFKRMEGIAVKRDTLGHKALAYACQKVYQMHAPYGVSGSLPGARQVQEAGFDVQLCGFGDFKAHHAPDEYCRLSEMRRGYNVLRHIIEYMERRV